MKILRKHFQEESESEPDREKERLGDPGVTDDLSAAHGSQQLEENPPHATEAARPQNQKDGRSVKRRFGRLPVSIPTIVRAPQFGEAKLYGTARHIGAGGMMVELRVEVVRGSFMGIVLETRHGPVEVEAEVVWTSVTEGVVRHGLAFRAPKGDDFIADLFIGGNPFGEMCRP
jgi:hypothetical protein